MASEQRPPFPPGTGVFRPEDDPSFDREDHLDGWNKAIPKALITFGRSPGRYDAGIVLSATVVVENPGSVVEYIAKFT
jgi:hypothetical protein